MSGKIKQGFSILLAIIVRIVTFTLWMVTIILGAIAASILFFGS